MRAGALLLVLALTSCGIGSSNSESGHTVLHVTRNGEVVTIAQDVWLDSTQDLSEYTQGRMLFNPPQGGPVSGRLLSGSAVQELSSGERTLKVGVKTGTPAGLTITGLQATRHTHLLLTYTVAGLVQGSTLTVPVPGSVVGRWSSVEVDVDAPATSGHVNLAATGQSSVTTSSASGSGWRYVLSSVPGSSPATVITTLS